MAATYEQAYATLKSAWWDDDKINKKLSERWLTPDTKEEPSWWEDELDFSNVNMIDTYKDKEWETKSYDEQKAEEWTKSFDELFSWEENSSKNDDKKWVDTSTIIWWAWLTVNALVPLIQKYWLKWVYNWVKKFWKWALKVLWKAATVAWVTIDEIQALANEYEDLKEWNIWNTWNAWKDAWQWALYNVDKMLFDVVPDDLYYNKWEDKEKAKEKRKVNNTYNELWWNFWSNLASWIWADGLAKKLEWWYLKEENRIEKEMWAGMVNEANKQLSKLFAQSWIKKPEDQVAFKKRIVEEWYKFQELKWKDWNKYYTWAKNWKPLQTMLKWK